jgi:hypothetical protein
LETLYYEVKPMANYEQLELFDLKAHASGNRPPDIYVVLQTKKLQGVESEQLELDLFPDEPDESYCDLKRAA